jgi:dephospho-CoA kinase
MNSIADFSTLQIGLTGSIGMGKSTVANQLKLLGFPVFDADHHVHKLYSSGGAAVEPLSLLFPHVIFDNSVNRTKLMETVMNTPAALKDIEQIVHPLVMSARQQFYRDASEQGHFLVVYDIPLLFENKAKYEVDYTIVVTASPNTQKERVLNRKGMTVEKFESMLAKQMSDAEKRALADFIIHTDYQGFGEAKSQLATIIEKIIAVNEDKWAAWKTRQNRLVLIQQQAVQRSAALLTSDVSPPPSSSSSSVDTLSSSSAAAAAHPTPVFDMLLFDLDDTLSPTAKQLGNPSHVLNIST